jgi:xanthine dehydrogenase molybdenum-binding subunit
LVTTDKKYKVIGSRPIRHDGVDKVTGRAQYGADIQLQGLLHGKVLRSPVSHARIKSIDTSKAKALAGVKAVVVNADFPAAPGNLDEDSAKLKWLMDNILASDKVLYVGHAVAAVAATDAHIAEDALALIDVVYEELPPVLDVQDAMLDSAPLLHEELHTSDIGGAKSDKASNVASHIQFTKGDIAVGFEEADVVIER